MKVVLESPFSNKDGDKFFNNYLYLCVAARKMMIERGDAPVFFHALYTQFLNDNIQEERNLGLFKSFEYHTDADNKTYAIDRGISSGMILGAEDALKKGMDIKFYTVMPENSEVGLKIKTINKIADVKKRWEVGVNFVEQLMENSKNKESFEKTGDLTLYSKEVEKELKEVKSCLLEFFGPIIDLIRKDNKLGEKLEIKSQGKKLERTSKVAKNKM